MFSSMFHRCLGIFFYFLESDCGINPDNDLNLFALHYIYLLRNYCWMESSSSTNRKNRSPLAIWKEGCYNFTTATGRTDFRDMTK